MHRIERRSIRRLPHCGSFIVNLKALLKKLSRSAVLRRRHDLFSAFRRGSAQTIDEMSREELIAYARQMDVELARLTAQHAKPLGRAVKFARVSAHRRALGVMTEFDAYESGAGGYDSAFHVVFEVAEQALRRDRVDRQVERQLARQYPEATAALVAMRRYVLHDAPDWPQAARLDYERNVVADAVLMTPRQIRPEQMEYWASLLDVFPYREFDLAAKASLYQVDDGATVLEEGIAAGRKGDCGIEQDNPYTSGTYLHAKWTEGYWCGRQQAFAERSGAGAPPDGDQSR